MIETILTVTGCIATQTYPIVGGLFVIAVFLFMLVLAASIQNAVFQVIRIIVILVMDKVEDRRRSKRIDKIIKENEYE